MPSVLYSAIDVQKKQILIHLQFTHQLTHNTAIHCLYPHSKVLPSSEIINIDPAR